MAPTSCKAITVEKAKTILFNVYFILLVHPVNANINSRAFCASILVFRAVATICNNTQLHTQYPSLFLLYAALAYNL